MLAPGWSDPGLATTTFLDHDSPEIAKFVARAVGHPDRNTAMAQEHPRDLAVKLCFIRYAMGFLMRSTMQILWLCS